MAAEGQKNGKCPRKSPDRVQDPPAVSPVGLRFGQQKTARSGGWSGGEKQAVSYNSLGVDSPV